MFQKGPKAEMEANKKNNAKKENIWNDSDETNIVYK